MGAYPRLKTVAISAPLPLQPPFCDRPPIAAFGPWRCVSGRRGLIRVSSQARPKDRAQPTFATYLHCDPNARAPGGFVLRSAAFAAPDLPERQAGRRRLRSVYCFAPFNIPPASYPHEKNNLSSEKFLPTEPRPCGSGSLRVADQSYRAVVHQVYRHVSLEDTRSYRDGPGPAEPHKLFV